MNLELLEQYMNSKTAGTSELGMRNIEKFAKRGSSRLRKSKVEAGIHRRIYAIELRLPFDPLTFETDVYNDLNPFRFPTSPTTSVVFLKQKMREDEELHKAYAQLGNLTVEDYDISSDEITEEDWKIFRQYRTFLHYSLPTQKYFLSGLGKFPITRISRALTDNFGTVVKDDFGSRLYQYEQDILNAKANELRKELESVGETADNIKKKVGALYKDRKVYRPGMTGTIRVIEFNDSALRGVRIEDSNYEGVCFSGEQSNYDLADFDRYMGGSNFMMDKLKGFLMTPKNDNAFDYFESLETTPILTDDMTVGTQVTSRDYQLNASRYVEQFVEEYKSGEDREALVPVTVLIPDFEEKYREYRDNPDNWTEELMKASVYEYMDIDPTTLAQHFKTDIASTLRDLPEAEQVIQMEELDKLISTIGGATIDRTALEGETLEETDISLVDEETDAKMKEEEERKIKEEEAEEGLGDLLEELDL